MKNIVSTVQAEAFVKVFHSGRTCPCLIICKDDAGNPVDVVVKLRTGKECSGTALICELIASLLARDLELPAPEPYLVEVDADFHAGISDAGLAERFRNSAGLNFGCRHLGPGFVTWPQLRSIPASMIQDAAEIFAFDLLIQNPDRRQNKPNLLRKGDELAIFDHEMAFSFLYALTPHEYPWDGKGMSFAKDHVFYGGLKGKGKDVAWDRMQGALETIDNGRLAMYTKTIPSQWQTDNGNATERIRSYLGLATNNGKMLFRKIAEVLI